MGSVSRKQTLIAVVAAAGLSQIPTAAIVVGIPSIHAEFGTSIEVLQWTVAAFLIPFAALLIAAGRAADVFGRRRLLVAGSLVFAAGSVVAGLAPDTSVLIGGIALAGVGGALIMPSSMSVLVDVFRGPRRGLAIGLWGGATEFTSGVGILIGGFLTGAISWRAIFALTFVLALMIVVLALRGAPESRDPDAPRTIDYAGAAISAVFLAALSLALIQGPSWGFGATPTVVLFVISALAAVAFVLVERRAAFPIFDFSMMRRRNFAGSTVVIFVMDFSFGAALFFLPLYFQEMLAYSPLETGVLLLPLTGLMVIGSPLGGRIAGAVGPRPPIVVGLALMAIGVYLSAQLTLDTTYADLWLPTSILGLGVGLALTPMNLAAMNAVSRDHAGAASGMLVTLSGLGATLGVAVTGAIFNELSARSTMALAGADGVTLTEAQARQLDGILADTPGAREVVDKAVGVDPAKALDAVREAFVSALGTSLLISAALIVLGLLLTIVLMRRQDPVDEPLEPPMGAPAFRPAPRMPAD